MKTPYIPNITPELPAFNGSIFQEGDIVESLIDGSIAAKGSHGTVDSAYSKDEVVVLFGSGWEVILEFYSDDQLKLVKRR